MSRSPLEREPFPIARSSEGREKFWGPAVLAVVVAG
jgi:hypothetical protein